ncbi:unnamed protein product [Linum tenue]|uniref:Uncharacterized protein n=1 Tax=Linum tenue TaxID=586396 RepID=A0AAV0H605_9ROSI|nr:unnamed protein product [Linum tenue]
MYKRDGEGENVLNWFFTSREANSAARRSSRLPNRQPDSSIRRNEFSLEARRHGWHSGIRLCGCCRVRSKDKESRSRRGMDDMDIDM